MKLILTMVKEEAPAKIENQKLFYVVLTVFVEKGGKFLILQRSNNETSFPGRWTIPGGRLETDDYTGRPKDTPDYWYNVIENGLRREVREEADIEIGDELHFVTSLSNISKDGHPSLVFSFLAHWKSGDVVLSEEMQNYAWVTLEEARNYDLIEGIFEEMEMAQRTLQGENKGHWKSFK